MSLIFTSFFGDPPGFLPIPPGFLEAGVSGWFLARARDTRASRHGVSMFQYPIFDFHRPGLDRPMRIALALTF